MLRLYFWSSLICLLLINFFLLVSTHMSLSVITPVTVITCAFSTIYQAIFISTHMSLYIHPVNHGPGHKAKWSSLNDQASVRSVISAVWELKSEQAVGEAGLWLLWLPAATVILGHMTYELCAVRLCANRRRQTYSSAQLRCKRDVNNSNSTNSMSFACLIDSLGFSVFNVIISAFPFIWMF